MYQPPIELYGKLNPLLQDPLSTDSVMLLRKQLSELEAIRYELGHARCTTLEILLRERERARLPKGAEYTDYDRKVLSGASLSVVESDHEFLLSLESIVKEKIELGIAFLQTI